MNYFTTTAAYLQHPTMSVLSNLLLYHHSRQDTTQFNSTFKNSNQENRAIPLSHQRELHVPWSERRGPQEQDNRIGFGWSLFLHTEPHRISYVPAALCYLWHLTSRHPSSVRPREGTATLHGSYGNESAGATTRRKSRCLSASPPCISEGAYRHKCVCTRV